MATLVKICSNEILNVKMKYNFNFHGNFLYSHTNITSIYANITISALYQTFTELSCHESSN